MAILPYCVVLEESDVVAPETGVAEAEIYELEEGGLRCFFSEVEGVPKDTEAIRKMALQFRDVIQSVFAEQTTIPFRFVTLLHGERELRKFLREHSKKFLTALQNLDGCVQFELHLVRRKTAASDIPDAESGTEYLMQKKAEADVFETTSELLRSSAGDLVRSWHFRAGDDDARCYALLARDNVDEFKRSLSKVKIPPELRVVMSGPWPPSEFVE